MFYLSIWAFDLVCNPVSWVVALGLGGAYFARDRRGRALSLASALTLLFLSLEPVSNGLLFRLEHSMASTVKPGVVYDAVILLGGAVDHGPTQSEGTPQYDDDADRLLAAFDVLRKGRARDVIVTGGAVGVGDHVVEAALVGAQLEAWGVAKERIVLAAASRNTREDATESARVVRERGYRTLLLLTSARHMPRSQDRFRAAGLTPDLLVTDFRSFDRALVQASYVPRAEHLADSHDAIREVLGRLLSRLLDG